MSILDRFKPSVAGAQVGAVVDRATAGFATLDPSTLPIASPWADSSNLHRLVVEDVFGSDLPVNTRAAAMRHGAVARARNLLCSTICRFPLVAMRVDQVLPEQPAWIRGSAAATGTSLEQQLAWTVDDLIFFGWSCWSRLTDEGTGLPLVTGRVNQGDWTINGDNQVEVNGVPQRPDQVILIPGLHEGILSYGVDVLEDARALQRIVRKRLQNPTPQLELHQTGGEPLQREAINTLTADWTKARNDPNGGVAYTSELIELREHGAGGEQLMVESRNAAAVDLARIVGVTASRVDATAPKASLNYETSTGRNQELIDFDLALYMVPITARLSLDDVSPPGERIALDLTDFIAAAPSVSGPTLED